MASAAYFCDKFVDLHCFGDWTNTYFVGFLRGGCSRGGGNRGTLRIPREDWGTLGNIRGITTHPLRMLLSFEQEHKYKQPTPSNFSRSFALQHRVETDQQTIT